MEVNILNKLFLICGKRESGKSQLLRYIISNNLSKFKAVFLFCPTERINNFYKGLIKEHNIFDEYNEMWIEDLMNKMIEANAGKKDNDASHVLLILDDCGSDTQFSKSKTFKQIATRGRHLKISVIMTAQYLYQLPPIARSNCDYIACGQMNRQALEILTQEFWMGTISKKDFVCMFHNCTNDYKFLLINNNTAKDNSDVDEIYGILSVPKNEIKKI
jgi:hypothetical protein